LSIKRRHDSKELNPDERAILTVIQTKGDMGISSPEITKELKINIPRLKVTNTIKSLLTKQMIKEVPDAQSKGRNLLLAAEFEPSKNVTGGS